MGKGWFFRISRQVAIGWLFASLLTLHSGCSGCRQQAAQKRGDPAKKPEARPKPPFEHGRLSVLPEDKSWPDLWPLPIVKPGHAVQAVRRMKANHGDFTGEIHCRILDDRDPPIVTEQSGFFLTTTRPAVLPKGQEKAFELTFLPPATDKLLRMDSQLVHSTTHQPAFQSLPEPTKLLQPYQNFFLVLARRPDSYTNLNYLASIHPPGDWLMLSGMQRAHPSDYVLVFPKADRRAAIPSNVLAWTTVAYVLWDDFDAQILSSAQQQALIDWLHWGGQLIVSGPGSLDALRGTFLERYLPARSAGTRKLVAEDVEPLNEHWSYASSKRAQRLELDEGDPIEALELELTPEARFAPNTGRLVAERRVGRGRVAVTAFALTARSIVIRWRAFDNFFNGCIMRRPPRKFSDSIQYGTETSWAVGSPFFTPRREQDPVPIDAFDPQAVGVSVTSEALGRRPAEALLTSKLRFFSRDASFGAASHDPDLTHFDFAGFQYDVRSGVAGWNDKSDCSLQAGDALTEAAGIAVPSRLFILSALGLYLFVLVPANWIVFRVLGHVEWAWGCVPVLAVAGTFFVAKLAQLDIGFVRSRTEIAIVETQSGYSRAHVTRYCALYTSLSTSYELTFADPGAVVQPFTPTTVSANRPWQNRNIQLARDDRVRFGGFPVRSNTTGMVHSEEWAEWDGPLVEWQAISATEGRVLNRSDWDLSGVAAVTRTHDGQVLAAWIGRLRAKGAARARFIPIDQNQLREAREEGEDEGIALSEWNQSRATRVQATDGELHVRRLLQLALDPRRLSPGDVRLAGWSDVELPGLEIRPQAAQATCRTVLVANLQYGPLPPCACDENALDDVKKPDESNETSSEDFNAAAPP